MMYGYNNNPVGYGYSPNSYVGNNLYQQQMQPQMQMPIQQQMQMPIPEATDGTIWVQGDTGARAYRVIPNNSVVLRNSENPDIIYIKSADSKGIPSTEVFIKQNSAEKKPVEDVPDYVTKSEFDNLKSRFENFINNVKESKGDKK